MTALLWFAAWFVGLIAGAVFLHEIDAGASSVLAWAVVWTMILIGVAT